MCVCWKGCCWPADFIYPLQGGARRDFFILEQAWVTSQHCSPHARHHVPMVPVTTSFCNFSMDSLGIPTAAKASQNPVCVSGRATTLLDCMSPLSWGRGGRALLLRGWVVGGKEGMGWKNCSSLGYCPRHQPCFVLSASPTAGVLVAWWLPPMLEAVGPLNELSSVKIWSWWESVLWGHRVSVGTAVPPLGSGERLPAKTRSEGGAGAHQGEACGCWRRRGSRV